MFVQNGRYLRFESILVWYPANAGEVTACLDRAPVVVLWQCPESLARELRLWTFYCRPFHTPLVDLALTEEQLWQKLEPKSCRYEVRKAQKMDCVISRNEDTEVARLLINDSIRRLRYRAELGQDQWQALLPNHDIFVCRNQGVPLAAHVILRDPPGRARLLMSGSADRNDERVRAVVGPCNRLLHWHELQHYKAQGFAIYDFGGIELAKNSTEPKPQFKLSFGGQVTMEPMVYLAKNPALRVAFRGITAARRAVRKILWPMARLKKTLQARS
jgi:hypothetical protein